MPKTCFGAEWGQSHFKTAHQHSGQRLPPGVSLQVMTSLCIAQLCLSALTALPHINSGHFWGLVRFLTFQEHYRTTWNISDKVPFIEVSPCLCKSNTLRAAALLQSQRDSTMKVHIVLDSSPLETTAPLLSVCPLGALLSKHGTLSKIPDWWRVRLKSTSRNL